MADLDDLAGVLSGLSLSQASEVAASYGRTVPEIFDHALAVALGGFSTSCGAPAGQLPGSPTEIVQIATSGLRAVISGQAVPAAGPAVCDAVASLSEAAYRLASAVRFSETGVEDAVPPSYLLSECARPLAETLYQFSKHRGASSDPAGQMAALGALARMLGSAAQDCAADVQAIAALTAG